MSRIRNHLLSAGVRNLQEFGYPKVTKENILTDAVFKRFFLSMLKDNLGKSVAANGEINALITEIEATP